MEPINYPSTCCEAVARYHRDSGGVITQITCSQCGLPFATNEGEETEFVDQVEPAVDSGEKGKTTLEEIGTLHGINTFKNRSVPRIYAVPFFLYLLLGTLCSAVALPFLLILRFYAGFILWLQLDIKGAFLKNVEVCTRYVDHKFIK